MKKTAVETAILTALLILYVYGATVRYVPLPNRASIKAVGVSIYWDANLTQTVTFIDWGFLEPAEVTNRTLFIQNIGNVPIKLGLTTENWNPTNASTYITLTWNYSGQLINANEATPIKLTLTVSPNIQGIKNFDFDIIIYAAG